MTLRTKAHTKGHKAISLCIRDLLVRWLTQICTWCCSQKCAQACACSQECGGYEHRTQEQVHSQCWFQMANLKDILIQCQVLSCILCLDRALWIFPHTDPACLRPDLGFCLYCCLQFPRPWLNPWFCLGSGFCTSCLWFGSTLSQSACT